MSLKSDLADIDIKDHKLQKYLESLTDAVELIRNNVIIGDRESKLLVPKPSDNEYCRILPRRLIVDEIKFNEDKNQLALRSSNSMWAQLTNSVDISIPNVTFTALTWDTKSFDTDGLFDSANPSRFTCQHDGIYAINVTMTFAAAAGGTTRILGIRRFLANVRGIARICVAPQGAAAAVSLTVPAIIGLSRGKYVEAFCYQDSGAALASQKLNTTTVACPFFQIHRLS